MKKLKLYLDTSVISHLDAPDVPEKMADTLVLWKEIKMGKFDVHVSDVVLEEIGRCHEPKRATMYEKLAEVRPLIAVKNQEATELANEYVNRQVLSQKSFDDCLHIALSVINYCDYLVSWNFKHLVNVNTISGVKIVNAINHYQEIGIISPTMLISKEEE